MKNDETPSIEDTIELLKLLREGEMDRGGVPYWKHPVAVMGMLPDDAPIEERLAALLHDEVEDRKITPERLAELHYPKRTIWLVEALDRSRSGAGMTYMEWIRWIADTGDAGLIRIKLRDNKHNSDPDRIAANPDPAERIKAAEMAAGRYARARVILERGLARCEEAAPGRAP